MLLNLRESMTGIVAKIVVGLVIAAMVLFGVESLFVNSLGGDDVAEVNGEDIASIELQRAISQQKSRLQQQFQLDADHEMLSDDRLRAPALMNLVRQKALQQAASKAGMDVSPKVVDRQIKDAFTRDGVYDVALVNNYIRSYGYTPATFKQNEADAYILRQLFNGINQTEFTTAAELDAMAAISAQKRSFSTIEIARDKVEESITVSEADVKEYYDANPAEFTDAEKIALEYVEVSVSALTASQTITDEELQAEYERESAEFESTSEKHLSHILIADDSAEKIEAVSNALAQGEDFAELAKKYSDDDGSKLLGGQLGQLVKDAFPIEFESAARQLQEGEVSAPVKTSSGTHFVRLDKDVVNELPSFESRKAALTALLKQEKAANAYIDQVQLLEEVSFGASSLADTAQAVGTSVKSTAFFEKGRGAGIAAEAAVAKAAFEEDVYTLSQNSRVIELGGERAVVIRLKDKQPSKLRDLSVVKVGIEKKLNDERVSEALKDMAAKVIAAVRSGEAPKVIAEKEGYTFAEHNDIERSSADVDFAISREAFAMGRPAEGHTLTTQVDSSDKLTVLALTKVQNGSADDMPKERRQAMQQQLESQVAAGSLKAFEDRVIGDAKYTLN